jgi:hypothetical protein
LTPAEFDGHVAEAREMAGVDAVLVLVQGGARISPAYRALLVRSGLLETPTAVLTDSFFARAEMTALERLGSNVRVFVVDELEEAFDFLRIPGAHRPDIRAELDKMRASVLPE